MSAMDYSKVAALYDIYVQSDFDVSFFIQESRGCHHVLELTSGTGRLSLPLIEAGVPLSCLDNSPDMLAILREKLKLKGLSASVYEMDISHFSIPHQFDLIIIPFNSFAEIVDPVAQQDTFNCIHSHLTERGRFICTLHNPSVRLKIIDGQIHFRGNFSIPGADAGTLVLSSVESYDANTYQVKGTQFYELYDSDGVMRSKRLVGIQFFVHFQDAFEMIARSHGFELLSLYGDYTRSEFHPEQSPCMIWVLGKR